MVGDETAGPQHGAVGLDVRIAEVDVAPHDRHALVRTTRADTGDPVEGEMPRRQARGEEALRSRTHSTDDMAPSWILCATASSPSSWALWHRTDSPRLNERMARLWLK